MNGWQIMTKRVEQFQSNSTGDKSKLTARLIIPRAFSYKHPLPTLKTIELFYLYFLQFFLGGHLQNESVFLLNLSDQNFF